MVVRRPLPLTVSTLCRDAEDRDARREIVDAENTRRVATCGWARDCRSGQSPRACTWCPAGTSIATLVKVEGRRWAIEDSFETAKNELGLDHNETRSWHGWHRHVSLSCAPSP